MLLFINVFDKLSFYSRETLALPPMPFKKCKQHFKRIVAFTLFFRFAVPVNQLLFRLQKECPKANTMLARTSFKGLPPLFLPLPPTQTGINTPFLKY